MKLIFNNKKEVNYLDAYIGYRNIGDRKCYSILFEIASSEIDVSELENIIKDENNVKEFVLFDEEKEEEYNYSGFSKFESIEQKNGVITFHVLLNSLEPSSVKSIT